MNKIKQFFKQDCYFYSMMFGLLVLNIGMNFFLPPDIGFVAGIPFLVMGWLPLYAIYIAMNINGKEVAQKFFNNGGYLYYIFPFLITVGYFFSMQSISTILSAYIIHSVWCIMLIDIVYSVGKDTKQYSNDTPKLFRMSFSLDKENSIFLEKHSLLLGKTKEETIFEFIRLGSWCYEHIDSENTIAVINRVTKLVEKER